VADMLQARPVSCMSDWEFPSAQPSGFNGRTVNGAILTGFLPTSMCGSSAARQTHVTGIRLCNSGQHVLCLVRLYDQSIKPKRKPWATAWVRLTASNLRAALFR